MSERLTDEQVAVQIAWAKCVQSVKHEERQNAEYVRFCSCQINYVYGRRGDSWPCADDLRSRMILQVSADLSAARADAVHYQARAIAAENRNDDDNQTIASLQADLSAAKEERDACAVFKDQWFAKYNTASRAVGKALEENTRLSSALSALQEQLSEARATKDMHKERSEEAQRRRYAEWERIYERVRTRLNNLRGLQGTLRALAAVRGEGVGPLGTQYHIDPHLISEVRRFTEQHDLVQWTEEFAALRALLPKEGR